MRPLAVLIGIMTGSAVALAVGLTLTWVVLLFLPEHADRFAGERVPLLRAMALFTLLAAVCAVSFSAQLRVSPRRFAAHAVSLAVFVLTVWVYWPRR